MLQCAQAANKQLEARLDKIFEEALAVVENWWREAVEWRVKADASRRP